ncbi:helix-turn-helix domain-containing protein [Paraburkholderia susongensis]|uniref:Transcriptional regulator, AraC family n=1 Tax=Paraburkholderia susongensis TaxID=1515439 RepID=A0A1X7M326_9BURK|nr:AraC family transcriptional regulator [Paraburkholderia susongensis]SMG60461.1 transcriptional regulator, AraC family [Paraburkholderia susongensis]
MISSAFTQGTSTGSKDSLGCVSTNLRQDLQVENGDITFFRKCMDKPELERIAMPGCERGFLVGVSLRSGHRRKIFRGARPIDRRFHDSSIYIRDFSEDYRADLYGNFDFLLVELSHAFLTRLTDEHNVAVVRGLTCGPNQDDAVLGHLARALAASLEMSGPLNTLFIEQLGIAIGTHLARQYGDLRPADERIKGGVKGALSAACATRAKEILLAPSRDGLSIADVARECNLSRGYFIRAFAKETGQTPHQWVLEKRTEQARQLMVATDMTLSEIAAYCGFADQSHLSRVFLKIVGVSPGAWRRRSAR